MPITDPKWASTSDWKLIAESAPVYQIAIYESIHFYPRTQHSPPSSEQQRMINFGHAKRYVVWRWASLNHNDGLKLYQSNYLPACKLFMEAWCAGFDAWETQVLSGE